MSGVESVFRVSRVYRAQNAHSLCRDRGGKVLEMAERRGSKPYALKPQRPSQTITILGPNTGYDFFSTSIACLCGG